jgi:predicted aspartyl protease
MGTFSVEVYVRPAGVREKAPVPVKCLVDSGASFCQFPASLLASLGVAPDRNVPVVLADGTRREHPAAWIEIRHGECTALTLVLFGGDNGLTLLGAHALEGLGLAVDPVRKGLEPGRFPLATV